MTMLEDTYVEFAESALDVVEQTLVAADWVSERSDEGIIHCSTSTRWGDCAGMFAWRDEPAAIHFSLTLDLRAPLARKAAISELLRQINERLWLGHFDYWAEDGVAVFRQTIPMLDRVSPEPGEVAAIITAAQDAVEQFLPAFNFVVWAGKSATEALEAVLLETAGEA
ncbi:hypothetical protein GC169_12465 [bacterium]|nr:hypothetical protein [bacterium]